MCRDRGELQPERGGETVDIGSTGAPQAAGLPVHGHRDVHFAGQHPVTPSRLSQPAVGVDQQPFGRRAQPHADFKAVHASVASMAPDMVQPTLRRPVVTANGLVCTARRPFALARR